MTVERVLIAEDDELEREFVQETLHELGIETTAVDNGKKAIAALNQDNFDLVLSDLRMAELDGMSLLRHIKATSPEIVVALMTAHGSVEVAIEALREGAEDVLLKPFGPDQIELMLQRLMKRQRLVRENQYLRGEVAREGYGNEIIGESSAVQQVMSAIQRVAPSKATVFVRGESGTGKELVARAIHDLSDRREQPFVRVNCAALSETLLESELFGHERGAFTGAMQRREGRFELAHHGTLLLDEVSEISPRLQAKLLRVLEEEEFERVGGNKTLSVDVRIIATSNRDLEEAIEDGSFRSDLFYRLHVVPIHLPSLRERMSDVPLLVENFLRRFQPGGRKPVRMTAEAMQKLSTYPWPGNVRELANFVQRAVVLSTTGVIEADDLDLPGVRNAEAVVGATVGQTVEEVEQDLVLRTLESVDGNRTRAADLLGLTARTICNKIRFYRSQGIEVPDPRRSRPGRKAARELAATSGEGGN